MSTPRDRDGDGFEDRGPSGWQEPAHLGAQPGEDGRCQQPQLGGPGGGLGDDEQLALGERLGAAVRGDVRPHQRRPAAEHGPDPGVLGPVLRGDQRVDQPREGLRVVVAGVGATPPPPRAGVGGDVVTKLRVVGPTAPSWKKGPRTVRGRGPRDTYG